MISTVEDDELKEALKLHYEDSRFTPTLCSHCRKEWPCIWRRLEARVYAASEALEAAFEGFGTARLYALIHHGSISTGKGSDLFDRCIVCDIVVEWRFKNGEVDKREHREGCPVPALSRSKT